MKKRILIISYYFEPCQAIGARRWSEFFQLMQQDEEYDVTVLTADWTGRKPRSDRIVYLGGERVFRPFPSINREWSFWDYVKHPSVFFRSLERGMLADPWYKETKRWLREHRHESYDMVIASYTPLNSIRLGRYAKKILGAKLVVDMRDMMSLQGQKIRLPIIDRIDRALDRFWLDKSDVILSVGPTICRKASVFYGKKVHLIYNAFLAKALPAVASSLQGRKEITMSYLGTMGHRRNPRGLIDIVSRFRQRHPDIAIKMVFASQDDPYEFIDESLAKAVEIDWLGYIGREEVERLKEKTDLFILLEDTDEKGKENVTGKLFEYMLAQKPIVAYCHPRSDISAILEDTGSGKVVTNVDEFESFLLPLLENGFEADRERILRYSREKQYERLKEVLS